MNFTKKILPLLLCMVMLAAALTITAFAAGGTSNVTLSVEKTEVNVGDTFTVTLSYADMQVKTFTAGVTYDTALVECVSIAGGRPNRDGGFLVDEYGDWVKVSSMSSVEQAATSSKVGIGLASTDDVKYTGSTLFTVTFKAIAAGTATFASYESTDGTDAFTGTDIETKTVTIKATTPVCNHENTKAVPNNNGTHKLVCTNEACNEFVVNESVACSGGEATCAEKAVCQYCETEYGEKSTTHKDIHPIKGVSNNDGKTHAVYNYCTSCGTTLDVVAEKDPCFDTRNNTTQQEGKDGLCDICDGVIHVCTHDRYGDITAKTHQSYCACGAKIGEAVNHDYSYDAANHKCVCGAVEMFVITMDANGGKFSNGAPIYPINSQYGDSFYAVPADPTKEGCKFVGWNTKADGSGETVNLAPGTWTFTENLTVYAQWCDHATTTAVNNNDGTHDIVCADKCEELIADNAAHNYESNYTCACGAKFTGWDGKIYVVNAEVQKTGWTKIDEAWYYLDTATGERATGVVRVPYNTELGYAPDQETVEYYNGKNETFVDATDALFVFGEDGKFQSTLTGVVTYLNTNRYVKDGLLVWNPGFVMVNEDLYYFIGNETDGGNMPAQGKTYIIRSNDIEGYAKGDIAFFKDGVLDTDVIGTIEGDYYLAGKRVSGLVEIEEDRYIYVRSNGELVANKSYWITNTNDTGVVEKAYAFDETGVMQDPIFTTTTGIVNGYYYEDGKLARGAGLIKLDNDYYYVRSSGQLAVGEYWITNTNDTGVIAKIYTFDENGVMQDPEFIVEDAEGVVGGYYYVDGKIACGAGLIKLDDGSIIYVRSNGQLATGKYWPTTLNSVLPEGEYDFGENGYLILK